MSSLSLPGKLADCSNRNPPTARYTSSRETPQAAAPSRDATANSQAILPLRGKILNVEKARLE